jgi:hypothetical protein
MAQKEPQRQVYRSMQGKTVDLNKLINTNELTPAVGNMQVNARGDKLGPGGKIIQKREELNIAGAGIPDQINVRSIPDQSAPVAPVKKDVASMDPEGKE